ncbi:hypothetical protein AL532_27285 [Pseudomonas monteilii]|uniref:Uncharacterized protein n=1 Tax=Pseudomonas kurunegalensis TaxID=485880 RepID=A0ACC5UP52_9PSED|nr:MULTISPECIES: hypothetical protein [Pseudomonas]AVH39742.1 hypothetical protein AL532_27285 [Pseudomonas monteilii]MBV4516188.1 hypothetical protein [Pseudomonas kurunegalensis]
MGAEATEQRLKKIICDHYLSGSAARLTINELCARADISRQVFHRLYLHLKPYLIGARNVDELLIGDHADSGKTILQCQRLVRESQAELKSLKEGQQKVYRELEDNLVTTLMNGDVLIHHSRELTNELRKKAIHNEILKRQLLEKELELDGSLDKAPAVKPALKTESLISTLKADLREAGGKYSDSQDLSAYYADKAMVVSKLKEKLQRILKKGVVRVVLFQNRFISSFDKFVEKTFSAADGAVVVVELPLAARAEIRDFIRGLGDAKPLEIYVPYCDSEATINAQRGFSYGHIPAPELRSFDKEPLSTIQDGFERVVVYKIVQGD